MSYAIRIERPAQRALARISQPHQDRIINAIRDLASEPRPHGTRKLSGREAWRIRIGDYRVIYEMNDSQDDVLIVELGHRREVYRRR